MLNRLIVSQIKPAAPLQLLCKSAREIAEITFRRRAKKRRKKLKTSVNSQNAAPLGVPRLGANRSINHSLSTEPSEVVSPATPDAATASPAESTCCTPGKLDSEALSHIRPGVIIYIETLDNGKWAGTRVEKSSFSATPYATELYKARPMLVGDTFCDNHGSIAKVSGWAISTNIDTGIAHIMAPGWQRLQVWIKKKGWDENLNQQLGADPLTLAAVAPEESWSRSSYLDLACPVSCDISEVSRIAAYVEEHSFAKLKLDLVEQSIALAREANDLTAISGRHRYYFPARSTEAADVTSDVDAAVRTGACPYNTVLTHFLSKCEPSLHGLT
jgi:hypothetical protein